VVNDKSGKCAAQHQFALLRALPCYLGAPAQQNFTQVPDGDIYRSNQVNLTMIAMLRAIIAETQYFGAHSSLPNQSAGRMAASG